MKTKDIEKRILELKMEQEKLRENLNTTREKTRKEDEVFYTEIKAEGYMPDWQIMA